MSRRRRVVALIILGGLCAALFALVVSIAAAETLDWLRKQVWYTPVGLAVAILVLTVVGVVIAVRKFLVTAHDEEPRSLLSASQLMRNRLQMIAKIRHDWIDGVLNQFPYQVAKIDVKLEDRPDLVQNLLTSGVLEVAKPPRALPRLVKIKTVFDAHVGGLLILGASGSGKTTVLLELVRDLLDVAEKEDTYPIPVLFNLSSWPARRLPLENWLVEELAGPWYEVPERVAAYWIATEQIVPLLDGLDEVADDAREGCVEAINTFRREHGLLPIAVCCRSDEYQGLKAKLRFSAAVAVQPLSRQEIEQYFDRNNGAFGAIRTAVERDSTLWQLLDNPLMLSVASVAYQKEEEWRYRAGDGIESWRKRLFSNYVAAMFRRRGGERRFGPEQTKHWLTSLAGIMARNNQAILYLESLDLQWLPTRAQRGLARVALLVLCGLVGWLFGAIIGSLSGHLPGLLYDGLYSGLFGGLVGTVLELRPVEELRVRWLEMSDQRTSPLRDGLKAGLLVSLLGMTSMALCGLFMGFRATLFGEQLGGLAGRLGGGMGSGALAVLLGALIAGLLVGLLIGLPLGLMSALFVWTTRSLTSESTPKRRSAVNEGTHRSIEMALVAGGIFWVFCQTFWLIDGLVRWPWPISAGLFGGLIVGLLCGGLFALRHLVLRLFLWMNGLAPLRYVAFLSQAKELLFLRQVGGGYIFVHRMLLEYFLSLEAPRKISIRE